MERDSCCNSFNNELVQGALGAGDGLGAILGLLGTLNVQVTGTTFNIRAYEAEKNIRITLVEGSVNVREG